MKDDGGPAYPLPRDCVDGGPSLRAYAAIRLCVPDSGIDWLDEMIRRSLRNRFAAHVLPVAYQTGPPPSRPEWDDWAANVAKTSYKLADAMLAERAKDGD